MGFTEDAGADFLTAAAGAALGFGAAAFFTTAFWGGELAADLAGVLGTLTGALETLAGALDTLTGVLALGVGFWVNGLALGLGGFADVLADGAGVGFLGLADGAAFLAADF